MSALFEVILLALMAEMTGSVVLVVLAVVLAMPADGVGLGKGAGAGGKICGCGGITGGVSGALGTIGKGTVELAVLVLVAERGMGGVMRIGVEVGTGARIGADVGKGFMIGVLASAIPCIGAMRSVGLAGTTLSKL